MTSSGEGDRGATPGVQPTADASARPKLPPPPVVGPGDRTAVTRAPRANGSPGGGTDPKELLPTLRMPPIEARAVRREVDDLAARLGIGKRRDEPVVASAETPGPAASAAEPERSVPVVDAGSETAVAADDQHKTAPLPTVPAAMARERRVHPQARRPPLPLPSVLRTGPRMMSAARMPPAADVSPSERSAVPAGTPDALPVIDTATLVADCALQLLEDEHAPVEPLIEAPVGDATSAPTPAAHASLTAAPAPSPAASEPAPEREPAPRRGMGWIVIAAAAVVLGAVGIANLGGWRDAEEHKPAPPSEASLSARADSGNEPALAIEVAPANPSIARAPVPAPPPALAPPPVAPPNADEALTDDDVLVDDVAVVVPPDIELAQQVPPPPTAAPPSPPAVAEARAEPAPPVKANAPSKRARKSERSRPGSKPEPKPAAAHAKPASAPDTGKPDAGALLREAEAAYAKGNWGAALRTAQRSQSMRSDGKALRIVAMAACKLQRQDTAQNAFDRLPLGLRKSVRSTCRDAGVKLRL